MGVATSEDNAAYKICLAENNNERLSGPGSHSQLSHHIDPCFLFGIVTIRDNCDADVTSQLCDTDTCLTNNNPRRKWFTYPRDFYFRPILIDRGIRQL